MGGRPLTACARLVFTAILAADLAACGGQPVQVPPSGRPSDQAAGSQETSTVPASGPSTASLGTRSPYSFDDEFDGEGLGPVWGRRFTCCGDLAGLDPSLSTVADGYLSIAVAHRSDGWYGDLIDTSSSWTQQYGYFAARIKIPRGAGLWPAFWGYHSGFGPPAEIDVMEVCPSSAASAPGSALHNSVHWSERAQATQVTTTPADLSNDFHIYAMDWRADHITFYLDGQATWTFTDASHIPDVPLPLILDLGVGGDFCGPPDATTPGDARMLVDWVRVSP